MSENNYRSLTIGTAKADIIGATGSAIQIAIDTLGFRGGGTVTVLPGEYLLIDSIRMRSNVILRAEPGTVTLKRAPLEISALAKDADRSQLEITPVDASGFCPGMGLMIYDNHDGWGMDIPPVLITHINNGVLYTKTYLENERWSERDGKVANYFPMIYSYCQENITVDGFVVDASTDRPEEIPGLKLSAICLYRTPNSKILNTKVSGASGDGIVFSKSSVNGLIAQCRTHHNGNYGIHPGSHSAGIVIRNCEIDNNASDGLYICWGISNGLFEENHIHHNGWGILRSGISIGHKDTDNLLQNNHIHDNAKFGICVRRKTQANGAHRNIFRGNLVENNGSKPDDFTEWKQQVGLWEAVGCGVNIQGVTEDLLFERNTIRETRSGEDATQQHGISIGQDVLGLKLEQNIIEGHAGKPIVEI